MQVNVVVVKTFVKAEPPVENVFAGHATVVGTVWSPLVTALTTYPAAATMQLPSVASSAQPALQTSHPSVGSSLVSSAEGPQVTAVQSDHAVPEHTVHSLAPSRAHCPSHPLATLPSPLNRPLAQVTAVHSLTAAPVQAVHVPLAGFAHVTAQVVPPNPEAHVQVYELTPSAQVPPF